MWSWEAGYVLLASCCAFDAVVESNCLARGCGAGWRGWEVRCCRGMSVLVFVSGAVDVWVLQRQSDRCLMRQ